VNLRAAVFADAEALAALHAASFDHPWGAAEMVELLSGPGGFGLVVEDAAGPAGFLLARAVAGEAEILTVAVSPERRGAGLGLALVEASAGLARAAGADAMFLEVAVDNAAALKLYDRTGFAAAGRRRGYYPRAGGAAVDALVLRRDLTGPAPPPI
jgi:ribosomal-protein-alanine N-acetyltransferase